MREIRVVTARGAAARDSIAIASGVSSRTLMDRAGTAAAHEILRRYADRLSNGVLVYAGGGNNGGDGWVTAWVLAGNGIPVAVESVGDARSEDARAMRDRARGRLTHNVERPGVVVDALLGTGARGAPRDEFASAIRCIAERREAGATVVSLDVPSGMDASSGRAQLAVRADCTVTFGTVKRGSLTARDLQGELVVVDIGLGEAGSVEWAPEQEGADAERAPALTTGEWVRENLPRIGWNSHKGDRKKLAIVGGNRGMAGAAILASRAALRSGIGMVRAHVHSDSLSAVQSSVPAAMAGDWPRDSAEVKIAISSWADGVLIGPGLGNNRESRVLVERILGEFEGTVLLDADALNVFAGDAVSLGVQLGGRPALLTPHPGEAARLTQLTVEEVLARRFSLGEELAKITGAGVLLKGVPTVVTGANGSARVSATGGAVLATAGSGDLLSGIAATLLCQSGDPLVAGSCASWIHGRAGELADSSGRVRGTDLEDVLRSLSSAWDDWPAPPESPVVALLPAAGGSH